MGGVLEGWDLGLGDIEARGRLRRGLSCACASEADGVLDEPHDGLKSERFQETNSRC